MALSARMPLLNTVILCHEKVNMFMILLWGYGELAVIGILFLKLFDDNILKYEICFPLLNKIDYKISIIKY